MVTGSSRLDGQVATVTGAVQGMGRGIALVLAEPGVSIWPVGLRTTMSVMARSRAGTGPMAEPVGHKSGRACSALFKGTNTISTVARPANAAA